MARFILWLLLAASGFVLIISGRLSLTDDEVAHEDPALHLLASGVPERLVVTNIGSESSGGRYEGERSPSMSTDQASYTLTFASMHRPLLDNGVIAPAGSEFFHALVADVTGDGRDDLISNGVSSDSTSLSMLYIYEQSSMGTLMAPMRFALDDWEPVVGLTKGDLNEDGVPDVVVAYMQKTSVLMSSANGPMTLVEWGRTSSEKLMQDVAAAAVDVDNDGSLDVVSHLAISHAGTSDSSIDRRSRFRVYYGDGAGGVREVIDQGYFGVDTHDWGDFDAESATAFVAQDVDGNGLIDLTMISRRFVFAEQTSTPFLSIYRNDGGGLFLRKEPYLINLVQEGGEYVAVGDFNGDGKNDLAVTDSSNVTPIMVYHQRQDGTFPVRRTYTRQTGSISVAVAAVDLNKDRKDDLLIGHSNWGTISRYIQQSGMLSAGVFTLLTDAPGVIGTAGISPWGVAAGDLNHDGCTDVAVAAGYHGLQVFHGGGCVHRYVTGGINLPRRKLG